MLLTNFETVRAKKTQLVTKKITVHVPNLFWISGNNLHQRSLLITESPWVTSHAKWKKKLNSSKCTPSNISSTNILDESQLLKHVFKTNLFFCPVSSYDEDSNKFPCEFYFVNQFKKKHIDIVFIIRRSKN